MLALLSRAPVPMTVFVDRWEHWSRGKGSHLPVGPVVELRYEPVRPLLSEVGIQQSWEEGDGNQEPWSSWEADPRHHPGELGSDHLCPHSCPGSWSGWEGGRELAGWLPEATRSCSSAHHEVGRGQLSLNGGSQDSAALSTPRLEGFKEMGKAGREQAIVSATGWLRRRLEMGDPLITQLD